MAPTWSEEDDRKIAWLQRSVSTGQTYLQSQTSYKDVDTAVSVISNTIRSNLASKKMSNVQFNRLKRQVREIISTLTNLNPRWDYETLNEDMDQQAQILNKRRDYWWQTSFVDRTIKEALQWAVLGAGYVHLVWGKTPFGNGQADVVPRAFGLADVIPDQIPRDGDIQRAYAIHIRDTMPLAAAIAAFPDAARVGKISPDRVINAGNAPSSSGPTRLMSSWAAPIFKYLGIGGAVETTMSEINNPFPEVDVYYTYIADMSVNETGAELHTDEFTRQYGGAGDDGYRYNGVGSRQGGTRGTLWEYTVAPLGGQVPDGTFSVTVDETGQPQSTPNMRPATMEESMLYPLRRLIIWTSQCVIYDGPSPWWHGKVPLVKFTFDKWPWQMLGYNMIGENYSIQAAKTSMDRGAADMMELRIDPPLKFNENEYSRKAMEELNIRVPGERVPYSGLVENGVSPVLEAWQTYELPQQFIPLRQEWNQELDYILGVQDFSALAKLQQAPSAESIDRLLQAAGPLIADFARDMEKSLTEFGYIFMWNILEFDNVSRRLRILGRDGATKEDFDFQPGALIPASLPGLADDAPLMRKGVLHGGRFSFNVAPHSAFNVTDIQNKLFYLQLWRDPKNFPIDPWSLAKAWNLPNFGEPPTDATNMIDRWKAWMSMLMEFQAVLQVRAQMAMALAQAQMMQQLGPEAQFMMGAAGMMQQNGMEGGGGMGGAQPGMAPPQGLGAQGSREGRPPTAGAMPSIENKQDLGGGGPRSTIAES